MNYRYKLLKKHENNKQLTIDFTEPVNKPWWMGIVCKPMEQFDLLSQGFDMEDIMRAWEIEDYKKTQICHS